jgi:hypothetical protein
MTVIFVDKRSTQKVDNVVLGCAHECRLVFFAFGSSAASQFMADIWLTAKVLVHQLDETLYHTKVRKSLAHIND